MPRDDCDRRGIGIEDTVQPLRLLRRIAHEVIAPPPHEIRIARAPAAIPRPEVRAGDRIAGRGAPLQQSEDALEVTVAIRSCGCDLEGTAVAIEPEFLQHE